MKKKRESLPVIALVGRPNVGKSRLFNRFIGKRLAIVENTPGVTRDRNYGRAKWGNKSFIVIDTGGFEPDSQDVLLEQMRIQAQLAVEEADVILFIVDGKAGLLPADWQIADILRRSNKRVLLCVNKIDQHQHLMLSYEFHELAFEEFFPVSAEHGYRFEALAQAATRDFLGQEEPAIEDEEDLWEEESDDAASEEEEEEYDDAYSEDELRDEESDQELGLYEVPETSNYQEHLSDLIKQECIHVAVLGKPNTGKSTLINRLLGYQRLLTANIAGTTRDTIDTDFVDEDGQNFVLIDTAGIRKKSAVSHRIEKFSIIKALDAVERADVVLLIIDAKDGLTDQDLKIAGIALDRGCALAVLLNKWDSIENKNENTATEFIKAAREQLSFCEHVPIFTLSALTGLRAHKVLGITKQLYLNAAMRVPTGELNRVFQRILRQHSPPTVGGKNLRFYYIQHVATHPPTFVIQCNVPKLIPESYKRFLLNQLRAFYGFEGSPIRLILRKPAGRRAWEPRKRG